ncbi:type II toxin-antitoxin system RelE/ParE family toxin [Pseudomonas sp. C27(2019)]|uniref:type II toxin-antitoxin system RelE family toxin n=1 Tax=Pseudomonas sp. C27(2019) TaxID=2604941 RepID=UPI0012492B80|nr:type II toxin-antitoxin system RelE/ParE family toxin [Pseudomonas sp. C27(2019)]QEY59463.1 type II toxin-antitoxin system RelE/ParE family toxin [Pseudomonas sp. C27(2019)]
MTLSNKPAEQEEQRYQLGFSREAQKEWKKLGKPIQLQFALKLQERLKNPHIAKDALSGMPHCYKIKLRSIGFRLVYQVIDQALVVTVIAVGKRERNEVYRNARDRL